MSEAIFRALCAMMAKPEIPVPDIVQRRYCLHYRWQDGPELVNDHETGTWYYRHAFAGAQPIKSVEHLNEMFQGFLPC